MTNTSLHRQSAALTKALLLALFLIAFTAFARGSAEAASSYSVYHSTLDGNDYYTVYRSSSELSETPTFISTPRDVYYSLNKENGVRITFYRSYNIKSSSQADAFYKYLLGQSTAPQYHAGWYRATSTRYGYEESIIIVYLVEGLNPDWDYYEFRYLMDWDPFLNSSGVSLNLDDSTTGDLWEDFDELWDKGCSAVLTIYGNDGRNTSYSMTFSDKQHIVRRYCVYETGY